MNYTLKNVFIKGYYDSLTIIFFYHFYRNEQNLLTHLKNLFTGLPQK